MKLKTLFLILVLSTLFSCRNENSNKQKELELKEKELQLKENEKNNTNNESNEENKTSQNSNIENLIGNWFTPHAAFIKMSFSRNGRFEFNDFNSQTEEEELLVGEYKLENGNLYLMYDDRPKQKFKFAKGINGDTDYYITKGKDYYLVKGEN